MKIFKLNFKFEFSNQKLHKCITSFKSTRNECLTIPSFRKQCEVQCNFSPVGPNTINVKYRSEKKYIRFYKTFIHQISQILFVNVAHFFFFFPEKNTTGIFRQTYLFLPKVFQIRPHWC